MKIWASFVTRATILIATAVLVAGVAIIRPVLAQEDASSTPPIDNSTATEPALSESTSTQSDTSTSGAAAIESIEPIDTTVPATSADQIVTDSNTTSVIDAGAERVASTTVDDAADSSATDAATTSDSTPAIETSEPPPDISAMTTGTTSDLTAVTSIIAPDSAATTTASADLAAQIPVEAPPVGLTEIHIIGTKYIDYFTDGTTITSYPGDPNIDAHFAEKDAPIPKHEGLTWVHTTGQYLYDTPSGDLEEGKYALQPNGYYISKPPPFVSSTSTAETIAPATTEPATTTQNASSSPDTATSSSSTSDATTSVTSDSTSPASSDTATTTTEDNASTAQDLTSSSAAIDSTSQSSSTDSATTQ